MLKFLIILILIVYLIFRVGGFLFKMLFMGSQQHYQGHYDQNRNRTPPDSNVKVDYVPDQERKHQKGFNGGQYVDYEEVK